MVLSCDLTLTFHLSYVHLYLILCHYSLLFIIYDDIQNRTYNAVLLKKLIYVASLAQYITYINILLACRMMSMQYIFNTPLTFNADFIVNLAHSWVYISNLIWSLYLICDYS